MAITYKDLPAIITVTPLLTTYLNLPAIITVTPLLTTYLNLPAIITVTPLLTTYLDLPAIITITAAGFIVQWTSPDDANLYVEVFGAVRLRGQVDSKNTWSLLGTVVSTIGRFTYDPALPSGYAYIVKLRVIDKQGRVSPFSHVLEVVTE